MQCPAVNLIIFPALSRGSKSPPQGKGGRNNTRNPGWCCSERELRRVGLWLEVVGEVVVVAVVVVVVVGRGV